MYSCVELAKPWATVIILLLIRGVIYFFNKTTVVGIEIDCQLISGTILALLLIGLKQITF